MFLLLQLPGQPYNQLAILASSKGDHLTTIFYYCRSIAVKFPFPAASTNLQKALSKALERSDDIPNGSADMDNFQYIDLQIRKPVSTVRWAF